MVVSVCVIWIGLVQFVEWPAPAYPVIVSNSSIDSAAYVYAGELLRQGGKPYLSYWDHKPPLIHLINAAGLAISNGRIWGVWLVSLLTLVAAVGLAYVTLRRAWGLPAALLGTVFFTFSLQSILASNMTEEYVLPVQWAAVLLLLRFESQAVTPIIAGYALATLGCLAFLLRANLIGAAAAVAVTTTVTLLARGRLRDWLRWVAGGIVAAAVVGGAVVGYLASQGALHAFWDQVFYYNGLYTSATWTARLQSAYAGIGSTSHYVPFLFALGGWCVALYRLRSVHRWHPQFAVFLLGVLWLPIELTLTSISGRQYGHYYMPLFVPLAFLTALLINQITPHAVMTQSTRPGAQARWLIASLAIATTVHPIMYTVHHVRDRGLLPERSAQVLSTVEYVKAHTAPEARVLVWGHAADVYFFSQRQPATRFIYPLPLLTPRYADARLIDDFLDELRRTPPALIIDAAVPDPSPVANRASEHGAGEDLVPSLIAWDPHWRYPNVPTWRGASYWTMTPDLKQFYDLVGTHYRRVGSVGPKGWVLYERNPNAAW